MPDPEIREGNVEFEPKIEPPQSIVYYIREGELVREKIPRGKRCNLHDHTEWSGKDPDLFIRTAVTQLLGVRESQTKIEDFYMVAKGYGTDFPTVQDHNSIKGALLLSSRYPNDTPISCEYTVNGTDKTVNPGDKYHTIHVGCPGMDFPVGRMARYDAKQVSALHKELMRLRLFGYKEFARQCERMGVRTVLNHAAWLGNPDLKLEAKLFVDWVNTFKYLEVNGGSQYENLLVREMAERYNKILVAGTDDHRGKDVGKVYVETLDSKVSDIYEFFREFDEGRIGIGSNEDTGTFEGDFNGTLAALRRDTFIGVKEYFLKDWGKRKWAFLGLFSGSTALTTYLGSLGLGVGGAIGMGLIPSALFGACFFGFTLGITWFEKQDVKKRTIRLYDDVQRYFMKEEIKRLDDEIAAVSEELKEKIEQKNEIIMECKRKRKEFAENKLMNGASKVDKMIDRLLNLSFMRGNYDFADDLKEKEKNRKFFRGKGIK
ncbi:MAG: PHP-associated domain-containing protein [Candidatus Woesearchaeota archaeon]